MSTYKRPELLKKQLNSLLQQGYPHFQIIVSDNDVEASAQAVVEDIQDARIKYFNNGVNLGMVKSFNKSLERSSGEYIVMITDDDPANTDLLSTLVNMRNQYPGYGVYAGTAGWLIENDFAERTLGMEQGLHPKLLPDMQENSLLFLPGNDFVLHYLDGFFSKAFLLWSCCMIERGVVLSIGGMPDYKSELLTDHAYMLATCAQKGMVFMNKILGSQSVRDDNFGFDFYRLKEKYINTPQYTYAYLKLHLQHLSEWRTIENKIWKFIGRGWVEYSLMLYRKVGKTKQSSKVFFDAFNKVFSNKKIHIWKYKFYLKAYCTPLFRFLLSIKNIFSNTDKQALNYTQTNAKQNL
jgi:glycosyltransferase involved in cell wall biosynthesis